MESVQGSFSSLSRLLHAEAGDLVEVAVADLEDLHTASAALAHGVAHDRACQAMRLGRRSGWLKSGFPGQLRGYRHRSTTATSMMAAAISLTES